MPEALSFPRAQRSHVFRLPRGQALADEPCTPAGGKLPLACVCRVHQPGPTIGSSGTYMPLPVKRQTVREALPPPSILRQGYPKALRSILARRNELLRKVSSWVGALGFLWFLAVRMYPCKMEMLRDKKWVDFPGAGSCPCPLSRPRGVSCVPPGAVEQRGCLWLGLAGLLVP